MVETREGHPGQITPNRTTVAHTGAVDVFTRFSDAQAEWIEISQTATISPYQSFNFLSAWFETVGRSQGLTPFIIVARDAAGSPNLLLPLCMTERAKLRIALFLGGREANLNLPLLHPGAHHDETSLRKIIREAVRRAPTPPDLIFLRNQPRRFENFDNPLAFAEARPSASYAYGTTLPTSVEELASRLSKDTRKKLRRKEARLAELGQVVYEHQAVGRRAEEILSALIRQKSARFSDMGIGDAFERCDLPAFLDMLREANGDSAIDLHGLSVGGRIVAAYAGVLRGGRFSAMLNSFAMDEEIARSSPGDLLLHALMRNLVSRGVAHFDLGAGEARYKSAVCDETIELCDLIMPISARGTVAAPLLSAFLRLKRRAKQSPAIARNFYRLKALIGR